MPTLAILSDIHADARALGDALSQIEKLGCEKIVCAGDIVDSGHHPEETIALLRERDIPTIRGNHDRWAIGRPSHGARPGIHDPGNLSGFAIDYLASLPTRFDTVIEGVRIAVRHATPKSDMEGIDPFLAIGSDARRWLSEAEAEVLVVGHTHIPFLLRVSGGGIIVNPGALLREAVEGVDARARRFDPKLGSYVPVDDVEGGIFGVLELPSKKFTVRRASDGSEVEIPRLDVPEMRRG